MSPIHIEEKFGSPPQTLEQWLEIYIEDTERYRKTRISPWGRAESRGRIGGLRNALELIASLRQQTGFPITIYPKGWRGPAA